MHTRLVDPLAARVELDSFVGRQSDQHELESLVLASRVVTISGPVGVGKSRLAGRVADSLRRRCRRGAAIIDVDSAKDASEFAGWVGLALMAAPAADSGPDDHALDLLLVLDNADAAPDTCADLIRRLARWVGVRVLVTSCAPLRTAGERVWPLEPLPAPQPHVGAADVAPDDSVALLVARMRQTDPQFELTAANSGVVAQLCRSLDGLPLALELAAARLSVLSIAQLASELDSSLDVLDRRATAETRHDSLARRLDRSVASLPQDAQRLFRRVAVFPSAWTLADAQRVCADASLAAETMLPLLADLVDAALVQARSTPGPTLFSLMQTTRRHALGLLSASGESTDMLANLEAWSVEAPVGVIGSFGVPLQPCDAPEPLPIPAPRAALSALTPREMEVARCIARGHSTRQIADSLIISEGTVRVHVEHIRVKLRVPSRADIGRLIA